MNTNWSSPKTNIISGMNDLRKALASGYNARLIKARNEDCSHPIKVKKVDQDLVDQDFRNYEFSIGYLSSRQQILDDNNMSEFAKYLILNYKACYGTQEAMDRYYETGELSADNFKGVGRSHLVKIEDMVKFLEDKGDNDRAKMFREQYITLETANENHFYDFFSHKHGSPWAVKEFRRKLWVVELLDKDQPKAKVPLMVRVIKVLVYPTKFIPKKSVLKMKEYKCVTYRWGAVTNGFSIEFHIPKKFSFKDN